ncbi:TNT domain-containing protein [Mycetocola saprophilus]|uniref:TNT domain-containing protein n=1 Tax=Mycetocola saprophilus TaxID=76636 RepID=UPI0004BF128D|nr:TNT domain-containing protein [Mycetocola saprophilus]
MSGGNSLVAGPVNTTTPFSGLWLIEDGQGIAAGIENGDWLATGMSVVGGVLDAAAAIIDPIGQLLGMGMAWVLDHVAPISDWFKQLTGDAGQVAGFGQTWANVATRMHESGDLLSNRLGDLEGMSGATIDAYRAYAGDFAKHLHMLGDWSKAISTGLQAASTLVQVVHDLIRDILSQLVGTAVSAVVTSAVTLGAGIPVAIAQIGTRLASLLPKATKAIKGLVESFKALQNMIRQLGPIIAKAGKTFSELMRKAGWAVNDGIARATRPARVTIENYKSGRPLRWQEGLSPADFVRYRAPDGAWVRLDSKFIRDSEAGTGLVHAEFGESAAISRPENSPSQFLVSDPEHRYGYEYKTGIAHNKEQFDQRFTDGSGDPRMPDNGGANLGSRVKYLDAVAFQRDHGSVLDRVGYPGGDYLAVVENGRAPSFEERALPPGNVNRPYHMYELTPDGARAMNVEGVTIDVSRIARGFGQPGGGLQLQIFEADGNVLSVADLIDLKYLKPKPSN